MFTSVPRLRRGLVCAVASLGGLLLASAAGAQGRDSLSFETALRLALNAAPDSAPFAAEARALAFDARQAYARPNPTFDLDVEDALGTGAYVFLRGAQLTGQLEQLLESPTKRRLRRDAVLAGVGVNEAQAAIVRADVRARLVLPYVALATAQERLAVAHQARTLADEAVRVVELRVVAGREPRVALLRAEAARAAVAAEAAGAEAEVAGARRALSVLLGASADSLGASPLVAYRLRLPNELPSYDTLRAGIEKTPALLRFQAEANRRLALAAYEAVRLAPDVAVRAGVRAYAEGALGLTGGVSIPIRRYDRGRDGAEAARIRALAVPLEARAARAALERDLAAVYVRLAASHAEAQTLRAEALPPAQSAFDLVGEGVRLGKLSALDVMDAQRALADVRRRYADALVRYAEAAADLARFAPTDDAMRALLPF